MMKNWENDGTEEIGLVTPTPGFLCHQDISSHGIEHAGKQLCVIFNERFKPPAMSQYTKFKSFYISSNILITTRVKQPC